MTETGTPFFRGLALARLLAVLSAGLLLFLMLARPLGHGASAGDTLRMWLFFLLYVMLPGALVYGTLARRADDWLTWLGMAGALGLAVEMLAYVAFRAAGVPALFVALPLLAAPAALLRRRRAPPVTEGWSAQRWWCVSALLLITAVAVCRQPLYSTQIGVESIPGDSLIEAGYVGELIHQWPLENPRVAGLPLNYHVLSYAFPAGACRTAGIRAIVVQLEFASLLVVALLTIQIYNAGRVVFRSHGAGLLAAALFM